MNDKAPRAGRRAARADGRGRIDYFSDSAGKRRWRLVSPTGTILATSEPFETDEVATSSLVALGEAFGYAVDPAEALSRAKLSPGLFRIARERFRAIEEEGFDREHDLEHSEGELAFAAACYALPAGELPDDIIAGLWPFDVEWFKRGDRIRELEKAGGFIAAEIDRLLAGGAR
jgi:hypothetical protein